MSVRAWIEAQIAKHSVAAASTEDIERRNPTAATRLADAAATLKGRRGGQVFGLELPAEGVEGADALADRCLSEIAAWESILDAEEKAHIGQLLERHRLPPVIAAPLPRPRVGTLRLRLATTVEDLEPEGDEEGHEEIHDLAVLAALHGGKLNNGDILADLPCITDVTGAQKGWVLGTRVELVFDTDVGKLLCELAFDAARVPSEQETSALVWVVERELLFSSWWVNFDWDLPDDVDYHIHVSTDVVTQSFDRVS